MESTIERTQSSKTVPFSFYEVVANIFSRYPNPFSKHIQSTDYIQPLKIDSTGAIQCKILNLKNNKLPNFMNNHESDIGLPRFNPNLNKVVRCIQIVEEYRIDLVDHKVSQLSWNANSRKYLRTHELTEYKALNLNVPVHAAQGQHPFESSSQPPTHVVHDTDTPHQCQVDKYLVVSSPLRYSLLNYSARKYAKNKWLKNEIRATHGLCYTIANNMYNKNVANEFLQAGLNDNAISKMKLTLASYRKLLYENRHFFASNSSDLKSVTHFPKTQKYISETTEKTKETTKRLKEEIRTYIKNPKFQLMALERLKKRL